jgi:hypothetical protein
MKIGLLSLEDLKILFKRCKRKEQELLKKEKKEEKNLCLDQHYLNQKKKKN